MANHDESAPERVIRVVTEHWIKYVFPTFVYVVLLIMSMLLFILAGLTAHHSMWLSHVAFAVALVLFFGNHHWFFVTLLSESAARIVVTTQRVIWLHDRLFSHEKMMEYTFHRVSTVEAAKRGFLQTLLRYGTLKLENGAAIHYVPHPNSVAKHIEQAMGAK